MKGAKSATMLYSTSAESTKTLSSAHNTVNRGKAYSELVTTYSFTTLNKQRTEETMDVLRKSGSELFYTALSQLHYGRSNRLHMRLGGRDEFTPFQPLDVV